MQLHRPSAIDPDPSALTFRYSPVADLVMALLMSVLFVAGGYGIVRLAGELSIPFRVVLALPFLLTMVILFVVAATMFGSFRSSLKPTNWFARVTPERLLLNLRSYRNAHFGGDDETVVSLGLDEVRAMRKVTETRSERRQKSTVIRNLATIELQLKNAETEALGAALQRERQREVPATKALGGTSRTKHHHSPVTVTEPGIVRIEWNAGLFAALSKYVSVDSEVRIDFDEAFPEPESRARALELRGERLSALRLARELGMKKDEALRWLAGEERRSA